MPRIVMKRCALCGAKGKQPCRTAADIPCPWPHKVRGEGYSHRVPYSLILAHVAAGHIQQPDWLPV